MYNLVNNFFISEEGNNVNSKNPFQSSPTNDPFGNKNPFFNGGWSAPPPVPVNPFMVSSLYANNISHSETNHVTKKSTIKYLTITLFKNTVIRLFCYVYLSSFY